ncbi:DnaA regulatory inactivator Hda [Aliiglaciecola sp. CAU 1673]|uniref:DnaA regulatory inactivator Hda n=1 Tax=Aliiglaciecola sp. CAU 1673 TaxID=3032595 RepID=UPI0023D9946D|nr:DnaA regulatory inactivator Hda [Aliiglaciecola sp. CAU 1673]MDF2177565.1 DnaA regulatory inactivator Hda [Aliiglaciecola sp. CAU 1673]
MNRQLFLPVQMPDDETFESFIAGENLQLIKHLQHWLSTPEPFLTYVSGESGSGKSHLHYALCTECGVRQLSFAYISFKDLGELHPDVLNDLEQLDLICLDDIHLLAAKADWQRAVFDLINRVKESGHAKLLVSALQGPAQLPVELADLRSRLSWGLSFHLKSLSDELRTEALIVRAHRRGMLMSLDVARFLLNHCHRDMPTLLKVLDKLDNSSLEAQRRLTIPFVKKALGL